MCFKGEKYFKEKITDHCKLVAFPDGTLSGCVLNERAAREDTVSPVCLCNAIQRIALELDSSVGKPPISSLTLSF